MHKRELKLAFSRYSLYLRIYITLYNPSVFMGIFNLHIKNHRVGNAENEKKNLYCKKGCTVRKADVEKLAKRCNGNRVRK